MMQIIDSSAPTADKEIRRVRTQNQKERIAPYRPSIDPQLAKLFAVSISDEKDSSNLVDWNFLDKDNGQPGEPAEWVKRQMEMFAEDGDDEDTREMIEEMKRMHRWTRNILPPSMPPRYDPNEPPFDPRDIF